MAPNDEHENEAIALISGSDQPQPETTSTARQVLVIEDTESVREIISETLRFQGFDVVEAEDGEFGVQLARHHNPDLILCDVNMPNMDGYDTLSLLKSHNETAAIPFIFLTGASDREFHRKGMELGADDYLTKPFTTEELVASVNTRLQKQEVTKRTVEKKLDELRGNIRIALPHELRTPLNGIIGLSSMMMEDYDSFGPQEVLENATHIHKASMRLHRLIENFLLCAQLDLAKSDPHKLADLGLSGSMDGTPSIYEIAQTRAREAGRDNDLSIEVKEARFRISAEHFNKALYEIVDNAFKFSDPGTPITITTSELAGQTRLTVSNCGRGMTQDQIDAVGVHMQFERQVYEQQGAGLGLGLVRKLLEFLNGTLHIKSVPGQTTHVTISLPNE